MEMLQLILFMTVGVIAILAFVYGLIRFIGRLTKPSIGKEYKLVLKSTTDKLLPEIQATDFYKVLYQSDERYVLMVDRQSSPQMVVDELFKVYGVKEGDLTEETYLHFPPGLS